MMKFFLHILAFLSTRSRCAPIYSHSDTSPAIVATTAYNLSAEASTGTSNTLSRRHHRQHDYGKPYHKDQAYFGYELPENTAGWVPTGGFEATIHILDAPKYRSINPTTGQLRQGSTTTCPFDQRGNYLIPDNDECCSHAFEVLCRTYKFEPFIAPGIGLLSILVPTKITTEIIASTHMF